MAFGKITKQDLVDAGLDPDKLKEFQDKGVTKDDLATLKTELGTSLATTVNDLIKQQFSELEGKLTAGRINNNNNDSGNGNNGNNGGNGNGQNQNKQPNIFEIDPVEFATDPGKHLQTISAAIVNNGNIQTMALRRDNAYEKAAARLDGFKNDTLRAEIDAEWAKYTPEIMVKLNTDPVALIKKLHDSVMGAHFTEIQTDTAKKEGKFNLFHTGGGNRNDNTNLNGGGRETNEKTADQILSPEEQAMAKRYGMSNEEWLKEQKEMVADGRAMII